MFSVFLGNFGEVVNVELSMDRLVSGFVDLCSLLFLKYVPGTPLNTY
jgi:hypothetical protein